MEHLSKYNILVNLNYRSEGSVCQRTENWKNKDRESPLKQQEHYLFMSALSNSKYLNVCSYMFA